ncbi:hypothetical protein [Nocardia anaemiae]|uniref:hypothetical protein n=1 Tax=Nocardia anaemiae TaxID=263910 RepID=UPI000B1322E5|nr:hypothetical protein [Nocardia anaemiae]
MARTPVIFAATEGTDEEGLSALPHGSRERHAVLVLTPPPRRHPIRTVGWRPFDQTVDRLCLEFDGQFSRIRVAAMVRRCAEDLAGTPPGALPELCERLARQRLLDTMPIPAACG